MTVCVTISVTIIAIILGIIYKDPDLIIIVCPFTKFIPKQFIPKVCQIPRPDPTPPTFNCPLSSIDIPLDKQIIEIDAQGFSTQKKTNKHIQNTDISFNFGLQYVKLQTNK